MNDLPAWSDLVANDPAWIWRNGRLFHKDVPESVEPPRPYSWAHRKILHFCYASHNDSPKVRARISSLCRELTPSDWGLNLGAGGTSLHPQVLNLDISAALTVNIVTRGQKLPFKDNSFTAVFSQEVIEHLPDPKTTIDEVLRVLKPGGKFYCQAPFIIGYHPGPTDFWRFTREGMAQLFSFSDNRWKILELDTSVGHGTGAYRILVELVAVTASLFHHKLYLPAKGFFAILLTPVKLLDFFTDRSPQKDRIPGGYFCVVQKTAQGPTA